MSKWTAALLGVFLLGGPALHGQDAEKKVILDDFEGDQAAWSGLALSDSGVNPDGDAKIAIVKTDGAAKVGKGALSYTYDVVPKTVRVLALQKPVDLSGMKSMKLWVKCTHSTAVIIGLNETGGATYQAAAHCPAGAWQEISVNLDELTLEDPAKDTNGKLDLDQIASVTVLDVSSFLVNFLPDIKGTRTLWLDDIGFSSKAVTPSTGAAQVTKIVPIHLVDNFETPVIRWIPLSLELAETPRFNIFDGAVRVDKDVPPGCGAQSLKFSYPRKGKKFHGIMRNLDKIDLAKAATLDLWMKSSHDGTYYVTIEEKDGSRYNRKVDLLLGDWKFFSWKLGDFTLADDSQDENGKLDPDQIKQVTIVDVTTMAGGGEAAEAHLWIDQVLFVLNP